MFISELVATYIENRNEERPIGRTLSDRTRGHLAECSEVYSAWLTRPATIDDFKASQVNDFLVALDRDGRSPYTVKNRRTGLMVLWRFAHRQGLTTLLPVGVRGVYCPDLDINGYTTGDTSALTEYAASLRGTVRHTGLPANLYWPSLLSVKWDHGLRAGDMLKVSVSSFNPVGFIWIKESKTGKMGWQKLWPSTAALVAACIAVDPERKLIWPGFQPKSFYRAFKRIASRAKLPGTSRWMRRGSSSEVERLQPGEGWKFLRHSSPSVFDKHYRVDRICDRESPRPPELRRIKGQSPPRPAA